MAARGGPDRGRHAHGSAGTEGVGTEGGARRAAQAGYRTAGDHFAQDRRDRRATRTLSACRTLGRRRRASRPTLRPPAERPRRGDGRRADFAGNMRPGMARVRASPRNACATHDDAARRAEHKLRALEAARSTPGARAGSKVAIDRLNVDVGNLTTRQTFHAGNSDKAQASAVAADLAKVTAALDAARPNTSSDKPGRRPAPGVDAGAGMAARAPARRRARARRARAGQDAARRERRRRVDAGALDRARPSARTRERRARGATQGELREAVARRRRCRASRPSLDVTGGLRN